MLSLDDYKKYQQNTIILSIFSRKGGVGKTSLAGSLAKTFATNGFKVLVVDDDPQQSLTNVCGINSTLEFTPAITSKNISAVSKGYREKNDDEGDYYIDDLFGEATEIELAKSDYTGYHDLFSNVFNNIPITEEDINKAIVTPKYKVPNIKQDVDMTLDELNRVSYTEIEYGFDLLPSSEELTDDELLLAGDQKTLIPKPYLLREMLRAIKRYRKYDIIIIDCPPSLGTLSVNAIVASDASVLVGMPDKQSLHSLAKTKKNFRDIKTLVPSHKGILGFVLNACPNKNLIRPIMEHAVKDLLNIRFYETVIPQSVKAPQAATANMMFVDMDKKIAKIFESLAAEILQSYYDNVAWEEHRNELYKAECERLLASDEGKELTQTFSGKDLVNEVESRIIEKFEKGELWEQRKSSWSFDIKKGEDNE